MVLSARWKLVYDRRQLDADRKRFPDGLEPIKERSGLRARHALWALDGLERIGNESKVYQEHPDWLAVAYDGKRRLGGGMLDLSKPEVAKWMEEQIARVIEENELDFYRLDYNVGHLGRGGHIEREKHAENAYWRYYENLYGAYQRLRKRFPNVIFETCSSGGAGTQDLGMLRYFDHTWVTDWQFAPLCSFAIGNGMTMALPPEYVDRGSSGGQDGHTLAELDFQVRLGLFGRPTITFPLPHIVGPSRTYWQIKRIRHTVDLYKEFVRPFMPKSKIYHHTPVLEIPFAKGFGVMELTSEDKARGVVGIFRLSSSAEESYTSLSQGT